MAFEDFELIIDARKLCDGGIGTYITNLVDGLTSVSVFKKISILVPAPDLMTKEEQSLARRWASLVNLRPVSIPKYSIKEYLVLGRLVNNLASNRALFHSPHYTLPFGLKMPSVVTIHDLIHVTHPDTLLHRLVATRLISSALNRATRVITVSSASKSVLTRHFGNADKIDVSYNCVADNFCDVDSTLVQKIKADHGSFLLFVGSDRPHKRLPLLLSAFNLLRDSFPQLQLIAISPSFRSGTRALVESFEGRNRIKLLGSLPQAELKAYYRAATAHILCSAEEGYGLTALEAMVLGTAVVSTPIASLEEVCGTTSWVAANDTPRALADTIRACLENEDEREKRIAAGKVRAQEFSQTSFISQTIECYSKVIAAKAAQPFGPTELKVSKN